MIVDDQDAAPEGGARRRRGGGGAVLGVRLIDHRRGRFQPEDRALALLALDADPAAHQFDEFPADGKAEPRSAVPPGDGSVDLREPLEETFLAVLGNARSGVDHLDPQRRRLGAARLADPEGDRAVVGELDGVAGQVDEDLAEPQIVEQPPRLRHLCVQRQVDPLDRGLHGQDVANLFQ
ncbi:MAG: hypothetical protein A2882_15430 [Phenylobacterium sp. RIFCSPHIGHO2_01_FULL_70_10]|nr:MAG: hypothetical protein A2882_15430 [Phenylobacterium sp. RIFCSPHIGHO2_01_FULL_70_10]